MFVQRPTHERPVIQLGCVRHLDEMMSNKVVVDIHARTVFVRHHQARRGQLDGRRRGRCGTRQILHPRLELHRPRRIDRDAPRVDLNRRPRRRQQDLLGRCDKNVGLGTRDVDRPTGRQPRRTGVARRHDTAACCVQRNTRLRIRLGRIGGHAVRVEHDAILGDGRMVALRDRMQVLPRAHREIRPRAEHRRGRREQPDARRRGEHQVRPIPGRDVALAAVDGHGVVVVAVVAVGRA